MDKQGRLNRNIIHNIVTLQCNVAERANSAAETDSCSLACSQTDTLRLRPSQHSASVTIWREGTEQVLWLKTVT
jgi:hypothetical protein